MKRVSVPSGPAATRAMMPDDLGQPMHNLLRHPRVVQKGRETIGYTEPVLDLAQGQQTAFRGQPAAAIKTRHDSLALPR